MDLGFLPALVAASPVLGALIAFGLVALTLHKIFGLSFKPKDPEDEKLKDDLKTLTNEVHSIKETVAYIKGKMDL